MSNIHNATFVVGLAAAAALSSTAQAGVNYSEEEATKMSDVVVTGTVTDVVCVGWMENETEYKTYSYKALYEADVSVYATDKGDFGQGDVVTISFSELVDYEDDSECGWQDTLIAPGADAKFFLAEVADDIFRQTSGTEPSYTDDHNPSSMPECGPSEDTGVTTDTGLEEEEEEEEEEENEEENTEENEDTLADDEPQSDSENKSGCQVAAAPAGLLGLVPVFWALMVGRRDD